MDNKVENAYIFVLFFVIASFVLCMIATTIDADSLRKANEQLKKEKYECKQELDKYKEKYLDVVVRGE